MTTPTEESAPAVVNTMAPAVDTHVDSGGGMSTAVDESTTTYIDILADSLTAVTKTGTANDTVACSDM
ncbi:hypothetical protein COLO4_33131 [Corchorus olitorius]|uniref:Uncharacterized protein n=1 Tax=Corchorus olitorius TaxID=93759 RepID=A0A1R3GW79_9ROSI|nr:hypothetical protein COLO4_33131 [Corchorus olitorius]